MGNFDDMEKLADRFMLISLVATCPTGKVNDKELAEEIRISYGASDQDVVDTILKVYNTPALIVVQKIISQTRNTIKALSQPWSDTGRGPRLIENKNVDVAEAIALDAEKEASKHYKDFLDEYDNLKTQKQISMGRLFKDSHWPTRDDLQSKLKLKTVVDTVPDPDQDVRAGWTDTQKEKHRDRVIASEKMLSRMAMESVAKEAHIKVAKLVEKLRGQTGTRKGAWRDTTLSNVEDMADILESFNLTNDPDIIKIVQTIRREVVSLSADVLRKDDEKRDVVTKNAERVANDLAARMGGFGSS